MFRKIEIWILYLVVLFGILFAVAFGVLVRQELVGTVKLGNVSKTALFLSEIPRNIKKIILKSDTFLHDRFQSIAGFNGDVNQQESYLLLSRHTDKEGIVELVNLRNFEVLHTWNPDMDKLNNAIPKVEAMENINRDFNEKRARLWHPQLDNDGGLVFLSGAFRRIDSCSDLIYQVADQQYHHSIEMDIEGNFWAPIHKNPFSLPEDKVGKDMVFEYGFIDDSVVKLSPSGDVIYQKSVSEIFIENGLEYLLFSVGGDSFTTDPIHLNDIQPVNFNSQFWRKGDLFLSLRNQSMVILYRPSTGKIIWQGAGPFFYQHDVNILSNHSISIFNNNTKVFHNGPRVDGHNEVVIYDFLTDEYSTYLSEGLVEQEVKTITEGRSKILPNGELFVEEQNFGRLLYFNKDGSLRWSFINRTKKGKVGLLSWSRILYSESEISNVKKFLKERRTCEN